MRINSCIVNLRPFKTTLHVTESQIALSIVIQRCPVSPLCIAALELVQYGFCRLAAVAAGLPLCPLHRLTGFWTWLISQSLRLLLAALLGIAKLLVLAR